MPVFENILANFALHVNLDAAEQACIKSVLQHQRLKKNEILLETGATCRNIYFVDKGCLRVYNRDREGSEHNVLFCPENWWAADMTSFSGQVPAYYNIAALETTELFYFSYQSLEQLYIDVPKMERFFRILAQNGFSLYQRRINSIISRSAEERYLQFQHLYPKLEQRIAQKQIASYLGITPVFLSMIRKRNG
ncbi:Crp/Fnr family transcriptional regulator [Pedobacter sp. MR2016-24]|uniref:Crp/Fnr family transcriptional regulator n=1 Tax=Pedobacter sp. MR2016-24 TaxID=2994466 RepID=UPI0022456243|nr:Crp/Fnr family transcriptional regulator [Pedobacter sp. MR2016-24]MCX2484609.1 Crp/Fnr family transcriptional regulator [Pedobacter sp. MR2016-24]